MVLLYTVPQHPEFVVYAGVDKHENEHLIKNAWAEDVWFHVDNYSSPHVYVRLPTCERDEDALVEEDAARGTAPSDRWTTCIPKAVLTAVCQVVKHGSIEGNKQRRVHVVYTPARNLMKRRDMDIGTVGYHSSSLKRLVRDVERDPAVLKPLLKSKREEHVDYQRSLEDHVRTIRRRVDEGKRVAHVAMRADAQAQRHARDAYAALFDTAAVQPSADDVIDEDDFM